MVRDHKYNGVTAAEVCIESVIPNRRHGAGLTMARLQIAGVKSTLENRLLPKLRSLESTLQPIARLPNDIFILIPRFFTNEVGEHDRFPMNKPLVSMTHVCRSWRDTLLSTPSLWTNVDFSSSKYKQAEAFLGRSGEQLLDICQFFSSEEHAEHFLSTTLQNIYRLRRLDIGSCIPFLEYALTRFAISAPELEYLEIMNDANMTERDLKLPNNIFQGRLPNLTNLSLHYIRTDLRGFDFPSLTRFSFTTGTKTSVRNLTSFFERCPSLEFIQLCLSYPPQLPTAPPPKRVRLAALRELRLDQTACASNLLDHLILPNCTEMMLKGQFMGREFDNNGDPAARIHPSSIDHLPVTRGITKATAMPNSCILSGPNGSLRFWCFWGNREDFDAEFFTSFAPISVSGIRELWVGSTTESHFGRKPWGQTPARVRGAFEALTKVEDLIIVSCEAEPFFAALDAATGDPILLPNLWRLTVYVGCGDLDVPALTQCAKARKERSRQLGEVTIVFENEPVAGAMRELELLKEFVGVLSHRVGVTPVMRQWETEEREMW